MYKRFTSPEGYFKWRYTLQSNLQVLKQIMHALHFSISLCRNVCKLSFLFHLFMQELTLLTWNLKVCIIPKVCMFQLVSFPLFLQEVMSMHNVFGKFCHSFPAIGTFFQIFMATWAHRTIAPNINMKNKKFCKYVKRTCTTLGLHFCLWFSPSWPKKLAFI